MTAVVEGPGLFDPGPAPAVEAVVSVLDRWAWFPSPAARDAVALWIAHTHVIDAFHSTPRLAVLSPEPGSGKSRVLDLLGLLVKQPIASDNCSVAAIAHTIGQGRRTLLLDEVDAVFASRSADKSALRGLLNSGHRRGGCYHRISHGRVEALETFGAVALAGLGELPHTLMTRSVVIRMHRRPPQVAIEPFRRHLAEADVTEVRRGLEAWAARALDELVDVDPPLPAGVTDRAADVWEPLLAVADSFGGPWPGRARRACAVLIADSRPDEASPGIRLLQDLRAIFIDHTRLATEDILDRLIALPDSIWPATGPRRLDARKLSDLLRPYGLRPTKVKIGVRALQGYRAEDVEEIANRYAAPTVPTVPEVPGLRSVEQLEPADA